ncbi:unnamed protein product [Trichogramma brassicae]|uniref:Uncharacterized protein n=1 Tax=Trichogramma brassicae TaxID=86971 RepID=A0A6H5I5B0_9HYME|nr:unnamed protein product [Trichogramma brassicae]
MGARRKITTPQYMIQGSIRSCKLSRAYARVRWPSYLCCRCPLFYACVRCRATIYPHGFMVARLCVAIRAARERAAITTTTTTKLFAVFVDKIESEMIALAVWFAHRTARQLSGLKVNQKLQQQQQQQQQLGERKAGTRTGSNLYITVRAYTLCIRDFRGLRACGQVRGSTGNGSRLIIISERTICESATISLSTRRTPAIIMPCKIASSSRGIVRRAKSRGPGQSARINNKIHSLHARSSARPLESAHEHEPESIKQRINMLARDQNAKPVVCVLRYTLESTRERASCGELRPAISLEPRLRNIELLVQVSLLVLVVLLVQQQLAATWAVCASISIRNFALCCKCSSSQQQQPKRPMLREYDETTELGDDLQIEFECKDEKPIVDLSVAQKSDNYPPNLVHNTENLERHRQSPSHCSYIELNAILTGLLYHCCRYTHDPCMENTKKSIYKDQNFVIDDLHARVTSTQ